MRWRQFSILTSALLLACGTPESKRPEPKAQAAPEKPVFQALPTGTEVLRTRTFTSDKQKAYKVETVRDDREEALRALPSGSRDVVPLAAPQSDKYAGTARKAAKLSTASAPVEQFTDLQDLIQTLPAHSTMANHTPKIKTTATSNRVAEEKRNVKVTVFLYAASREDDNDFHLILGRDPAKSPPVYFTMELSGLPANNAASFAKLKAARDAFKAFFGTELPGQDYDFYSPPIPVEVEGSLFFDMSHATGNRPGPASLRSKMPVVWEVHPITRITFEP